MKYLKSFKIFENNNLAETLVSLVRTGDITNIELVFMQAEAQNIYDEFIKQLDVLYKSLLKDELNLDNNNYS